MDHDLRDRTDSLKEYLKHFIWAAIPHGGDVHALFTVVFWLLSVVGVVVAKFPIWLFAVVLVLGVSFQAFHDMRMPLHGEIADSQQKRHDIQTQLITLMQKVRRQALIPGFSSRVSIGVSAQQEWWCLTVRNDGETDDFSVQAIAYGNAGAPSPDKPAVAYLMWTNEQERLTIMSGHTGIVRVAKLSFREVKKN